MFSETVIPPPVGMHPSKFAVATAAPAPTAAPAAAPVTVARVSRPRICPAIAPIAAPVATFFTSSRVVLLRTRSTCAELVVPLTA